MPYIELTRGKKALVDAKVFKILSIYQWQANRIRGIWYAETTIRQNGKRTTYSMHRMILGLKHGDGKYTDHINHNGLDNRQCNLRICTRSENEMNRRRNKNSSSKFKGVSWHKWLKK